VTIGNRQHHFRGTLVAFVGDTPAVCMAGGLKEGVGMAMHKSRHCMELMTRYKQRFGCVT
jgi:hypothetical protein